MMTPEQLVSALQHAIGSNLKSVILYGSAAAKDFVAGVSGHDILILTERLDADQLKALAATLERWTQAGNPLPQLFTGEELANSTDVFPIEIRDIQQARRVLYGSDPLGELQIDMPHYRMQLERELKTRLQLLRRSYVTCVHDDRRIAELMLASISTFLVLLRASLRLYNDSVPAEKVDALDQLSKHLAFDPEPLRTVLNCKNQKSLPDSGEIARLFARYLSAIEQVVQGVDRHLHPSHAAHQSTEGPHG